MELSSKNILIISPQPWDGLFISKHNYAIELAKRGNKVYFLYKGNGRMGQLDLRDSGIENLNLLCYNDLISRRIQFHFRPLYNLILWWTSQRIRKHIDHNIDIVWSFDLSMFINLNWFNAKIKIFHPVDKVKSKEQHKIGSSADIIFSVSDVILDQFKDIDLPKYVINHGLSDYYLNKDSTLAKQPSELKFAYIGNITMNIIDHESLKSIINKFPNCQFDFFGKTALDPTSSEGSKDFIHFLKSARNVNLKGVKHPSELAEELSNYHGFLICYALEKDLNQGSNSHKMLEYLSFGKPIVSSKIRTYENYPDLICMSKQDNNSDYVNLFENLVNNYQDYNTIELFNRRRELAFDNTYARQVNRIESKLLELFP